ncbi:hypothetical protein EGW08_009857 [Elysia chlorotica]|uniref:Uncharacterized protein n=1 Tax=Elysia chlorotica TaxID=188477 RepID=A0A3S1BFB5_ELYCH|nr:hypothetical protein EGW08_009857 [Elysia chlorotica]
MESIQNDTRFSHISSDPRFRPMPKSKKKVKIDSRFQSLFTDKNFTHKTNIDKRGRPTLSGSKKQKHVMERFYDLSDSESDDADDRDLDVELSSASGVTDDKKNKKATKMQPTKSSKRKLQKDKEKSSLNNKKRRLIATDMSSDKDNDKDEISGASSDEDEQDNSNDSLVKKGGHKDVPSSDDEDGSDDYEEMEEVDSDIAEYTQDHELEETEVDHKWNELHTEAPGVTDSTKRLAVCNMDWDFVKAQDLFVLFKSFVPDGGAVKSVSIYPSEFGKERMAEEALLGPKEMRKQHNGDVGDNTQDDRKGKKQKNAGGDQQKAKRLEKHKENAQTEKLREYQLNRLRYYYAVVECDSVRTADNIYAECDGREYQLSSVRLDLRFIPDDMIFDDPPKESFTDQQGVADYEPSQFNSSALSQAKVEVTWDETEFDRLSRRMSALQQKELQSIVEENKYADIIAPPESDSEVEDDERPQWLKNLLAKDGSEDEDERTITEEEKIRLYRQVLMEKVAEDEEEEKKEEGELDKEMAWQPGLKSAAEKKMKKQEKKRGENVIIGGYLEKKKEKKKKKKDEKMKKRKEENGEDEEDDKAFSDDELPAGFDMEDMREMFDGDDKVLRSDTQSKSAKTKKKKKGQAKVADEDISDTDEKARAELELMLMDNDTVQQKKPGKLELVKDSDTKKKKKKNKLAKLKKTEEDREDFVLDMEDPRFSALYSSHHFHIDPTAPQFKKTKNMIKLVDEQIKRKGKKDKKGIHEGSAPERDGLLSSESEQMSNSKSKSQSLLESLKRKMKK